ncbi:MAG: hypothetical protein KDB65_13195 [Calditrichaeota bacterium]|nr:hypothetical protein [Calditrichota bacterium]MCB9367616.1 hypothetical protein [Calditrichota bacterium]
MARWKAIRSFISITCLATGSFLYLLFRSKSLLMFRWADSIGLNSQIEAARMWIHDVNVQLPIWAIYSMPYALWVLAYMIAIDVIWDGARIFARHVWFWSVPVAAVLSELAQGLHMIPGRFDLTDLASIALASLLGFGVSNVTRQREGIAAL